MPRELPPIKKRLKYFRCHRDSCQANDMGRFFAMDAKCPQCGLTQKDPKFGDKLQRLAIVHFDPPTDFAGRGENVRACEPSEGIQCKMHGRIPNPFHAGSGNASIVNCPDCMQTEIYQYAMALIENEDGPDQLAGAFARLEEARRDK